ncbi:hypothetical protein GCM10008986_18900 [Salinibacillus aidingensis]|uniref:Antigen I/II N-terminal domain-containing protein n=1 Tax=Salinibacillus aidingensis TaxID=237684 RepID=A0ABN1B9E8_9BACI
MKKTSYVLLIVLLTFLTACSSNDEADNNGENKTQTEESANTDEQKSTNEEGKVDVDKNLLSVEVTLPASMFENQDPEEVIASAEEDGIKVTENDDGSYTYKMSKAKHKEMMAEMGTEVKNTVDEMVSSGDYTSIKDITYNNDFSEFTMVVEREAYENSMDAFAAMGLGMSGMMYQLFDGADPDEYSVAISLKDEASGEVFNQVKYPEALEETE